MSLLLLLFAGKVKVWLDDIIMFTSWYHGLIETVHFLLDVFLLCLWRSIWLICLDRCKYRCLAMLNLFITKWVDLHCLFPSGSTDQLPIQWQISSIVVVFITFLPYRNRLNSARVTTTAVLCWFRRCPWTMLSRTGPRSSCSCVVLIIILILIWKYLSKYIKLCCLQSL